MPGEKKLSDRWRALCDAPLLFDHFQKVAVIYDALKDGTQSKSIMATECSRETDDGDDMGQLGWFEEKVRAGDLSTKMRQEAAVTWRE